MCGITGFFRLKENPFEFDPKNTLQKMTKSLSHRGPDSSGTWISSKQNMFLGHSRLSILDLSYAGAQPMVSNSKKYIISFNGEVYNHLELRKKANGYSFKGNSDTETLLSMIELYGVKKSLKMINGMFSFALWDDYLQELTLARDRIGEKPLYYFKNDQYLIFGSELKSLVIHPSFKKNISKKSVSLLMQYSYIPTPKSIYKNTFKLQPGKYLKIKNSSSQYQIRTYWSPEKTILNRLNSFEGSKKDAINGLNKVLKKAVNNQMLSDKPIGAFLSGGIDSSLIVSIMQSLSNNPVKTFSIGFEDKFYNEADKAKDIAKYLGTDHTELYLTQEDVLTTIPKLSSIFCEPFADCSQIPTYVLSKLTQASVSVSLSGDGGDELFGGYNRYGLIPFLWKSFGWINPSLRSLFSNAMQTPSPKVYNLILEPFQKILPTKYSQSNIGDKIHKFSNILDAKSESDLFQKVARIWPLGSSIMKSKFSNKVGGPAVNYFSSDNFINDMMATDMINYLPDDILVKVDRTAMSVSLETRVPFLDREVIEYAWSLPVYFKVKEGKKKVILNDLLEKYLPKTLFNRPKMGFGLPISDWLRDDLKDWAESLLDKNKLKDSEYFSVSEVRKKWEEHLTGKVNWQYQLWNILIFQQWMYDNQ